MSKDALIKRLKKEYILEEYVSSRGITRVNQIKRYGKDAVRNGDWDGNNARGLTYKLFKIGNDNIVYQPEFVDYILSNQSKGSSIDELYMMFLNEKFIEHEENNLSSKYPEYKLLLKEYRDGILLFDLTNKKVWGKAVEDTLGLRDFYNN